MTFSRHYLAQRATLDAVDLAEVQGCRRAHNQLGFAYQVGFVRLLNRFPKQEPFEVLDELLLFTSVQLGVDSTLIEEYRRRRQTISEHQQRITRYRGLCHFGAEERRRLEAFVFEAAARLEQTSSLHKRAEEFLAEQRILRPRAATLGRLVGEQRQQARDHIVDRVAKSVSREMASHLDTLLVVRDGESVSPLHAIKSNPGHPSVESMRVAVRKLGLIEEMGVLDLDLSWLNSNYQRALFHKVRKSSAHRLRELKEPVRRAVLACFLRQSYGDAVDHVVVMFSKLMTKMERQADDALDEQLGQHKNTIYSALGALARLGPVILDETLPEHGLREKLFAQVPRDELAERVARATEWVSGRKSDSLHGVVTRYGTLRRFTPAFLEAVSFLQEDGSENGPCLQALAVLRDLNASNKRKLPTGTATAFLSTRWKRVIGSGDEVRRSAWECAVLLKTRDEIRAGNLAVRHRKRFGHLDDFFIPDEQWETARDRFFARSGLPAKAIDVPAYLERRLSDAFDRFLAAAPTNDYASVTEQGWQLSVDATDRLDDGAADQLAHLQRWLATHMRKVRLPDLLIEVDNDLGFTRHFLPPSRQPDPAPDEICVILAAIMAHGCNIGPHTMAQLTADVTYEQLKRVGDWQLTRDTQREALGVLVKAIAGLDTSLYWGEGKTSASDGQRYSLRRKVLQKTYSPRFSDFALEFYSFVADNYAPFFSTPIECTDRDAATVLDGLLYNESDLELEEHYTDTHGYTDINFAAFAMLGRRFSPRIRGLKKQRLYRVDTRDYGTLGSLVGRADRKIDTPGIADQWDRLGHFYASLESGHTTASVALRRLAGFSAKNGFYRANRDLGRILKTEFILQYMSQPALRTRIRGGLLKVEQMHALARDVFYGNRGRINARDLWEQMNSCSCLTLIVACIIYWQARDMSRVIRTADPQRHGIELSLLRHVSPIEWDNIVLYGEYVLNRRLVRRTRSRP